jgi:Tol biopolymer transport system component
MQGQESTPSISPDGSKLVFVKPVGNAQEVWIMGAAGESSHGIAKLAPGSFVPNAIFSPLGTRVAYQLERPDGDSTKVSIESCDLNGANPTTILKDDEIVDFRWIPGQVIYSRWVTGSRETAQNLWELKVDSATGVPREAS